MQAALSHATGLRKNRQWTSLMLRVEFHEGCEHSDPATGRPASSGPFAKGRKTNELDYVLCS
jgi:hypothetical protein